MKARIIGDPAELGPFESLNFFGHALTREWSGNLDVTAEEARKLKGNRYVEVKGGPLDLDNNGEDGGSLTVPQLKERLTELGVEVPAGAKKAELQTLLSQAEAAHAAGRAEAEAEEEAAD